MRNYSDIYSVMASKGLTDEPAFKNVKFSLEPIQCYSGRCPFGLYDPNTSTVILPPNFSDAALLHELGHRYEHYQSGQGMYLDEDYAEAFRERFASAPMAPYLPNGAEGTWEEIARANVSPSGIQSGLWKAFDEIQPNTDGLMRLSAPGIGPVMNAAGVEQIVQSIFVTQGAHITVVDCYGEGWNDGYIRFKGSPVAILLIMAALVPILQILLYIGIVVAVSILIFKAAAIAKEAISNPLPVVLIAGTIFGGLYLLGRGKS